MNQPYLIIRQRNLPHWTIGNGVYFVTFRVARGRLSFSERAIVLQHLRDGQRRFYEMPAAIIMPDHVHLIIKPLPSFDLSQNMKGIKGVTARKINLHRSTKGRIWQDESWDRLLRDYGEFEEKLQYMANNPVKAGLVKYLDEYPFWYLASEFI